MIEGLTLLPVVSGMLFYLLVLATVSYSLIFGYHWYQFGTNKKHVNRALLIYLLGAISLLIYIFITQNYVIG